MRAAGVVVALVLAGCIAADAPEETSDPVPVPPAWSSTPLNITCTATCFEPTLAVVDGVSFVATAVASEIFRSADHVHWDVLPPPPRPEGADPFALDADIMLYSHEGSLYYLAVVGGPGTVFNVNVGFVFEGFHVARSDDLGDTWPVNVLLGPGGSGEPMAGERPWLTFADEAVHLVWPQWHYAYNAGSVGGEVVWQAVGEGVWVRASSDAGATWDAAKQVVVGRMAFASPVGGSTVAASVTDIDQTRVLRFAEWGDTPVEVNLGEGSLRFPSLLEKDGARWIAVTHDGRIDVHHDGAVATLEGNDLGPSAVLHARPAGGVDLAYSQGDQMRILRVNETAGLMGAVEAPEGHWVDVDVHAPTRTDFVQLTYVGDEAWYVGSDEDVVHLVKGPA